MTISAGEWGGGGDAGDAAVIRVEGREGFFLQGKGDKTRATSDVCV